ncbi:MULTISPECIES: sugar ABC transporter substrate-binding protein [Pelosinus]|jgi:D-xylose transport system substrate-binding protein|uniref:Periplasmic binding protein/LacI transcriptional regulator n=1 Tax=Pelosinus fermentans B4 TaxID=1149862 RepID=I8RKF8_9FIRM|nr:MULTISPECIES: substrate-binding domain-containing protein [Pelosinus]MDF2570513.1 Periplasmic binding protein domain containing protein [Sporomusa sp.]EIW18845.1 periplasmic binding protein/LacI transcriptional regulator [Pelosinus fermentans B4]EIW21945.1 periplasmic binding protein/LacI transcriptional regulator [Pelosinus fermentans A11]OAM95204.1 Periplasmic binding protein domain containing protein [Pelosinus fermentans DSM 17108]SDR24723.1 D-xylose transport system substrate-binding p
MKKIVKICTFILMISIIVSMFIGCKSNKTINGHFDDNKVKIGVSLPKDVERWNKDKEAIEAEAKKLGIELLVQVAGDDSVKQALQCDELIKQNVKVIILAPCDAKASAAIVSKAHAAGIRVIAYDGLIIDSDVDLYLSFDNEKVGELQAQYLVDKAPSGNYVILSGDPNDNNAKLYKAGAMKIIKPLVDKGRIQIVYDQACKDYSHEEAAKHIVVALAAQNNNIQAVLAPNDETAGGVIGILAAHGMAGKVPISGQDAETAAVKRIIAGTQNMTVFKDTRELGKTAFSAAIKLAKGQVPTTNGKVNNNKMDVPSILLPPDFVDKSNIMQMLVYSGYLNKEDIVTN